MEGGEWGGLNEHETFQQVLALAIVPEQDDCTHIGGVGTVYNTSIGGIYGRDLSKPAGQDYFGFSKWSSSWTMLSYKHRAFKSLLHRRLAIWHIFSYKSIVKLKWSTEMLSPQCS